PGIFWRFNDFHADSAAVGSIIIPLRKNCDNDTYALYADLYWYDSCYTDLACADVDRYVVGNSTINLPTPQMDLDHAAPSPINYCESFIDTITITRTSTSTAYEPNLFLASDVFEREFASFDSISYGDILADTTNMIEYGPVDTTLAGIPGIYWHFADFHADSTNTGAIIIPLSRRCDAVGTDLTARLQFFPNCIDTLGGCEINTDSLTITANVTSEGPSSMTLDIDVLDPVNFCDPVNDTLTLTRTSSVTANRPSLFVALVNFERYYAAFDSILYGGVLADTASMITYGPVDTTIAGTPGMYWQFADFHEDSLTAGTIIIPIAKNCDNEDGTLSAQLKYFPHNCCLSDIDSVDTDVTVTIQDEPGMVLGTTIPDPVVSCQPFNNTITVERTSPVTAHNPNLFVPLDNYSLEYADFDSIVYGGVLADTANWIVHGPVDTTITGSQGIYWQFADFHADSASTGTISIPMMKPCDNSVLAFEAILRYYQDDCCSAHMDSTISSSPTMIYEPNLLLFKFPEVFYTTADTVYWDVTAINFSPVTAYNVLLVDSLSAALSYRSHTITGAPSTSYVDSIPAYEGNSAQSINGVSCLIDSMEAFSIATLRIIANFEECFHPWNYSILNWGCDSTICVTLIDSATVDWPSADLELVNQVSLQNLTACTNDTVSVEIRNSGQTTDYDITLHEFLPDGLHYVQGSTTIRFNTGGGPYLIENGAGADPHMFVSSAGSDSLVWYFDEYPQLPGSSDSCGTIIPGHIILLDFVVTSDCDFPGGDIVPTATYREPCGNVIAFGATSSSVNSLTPQINVEKMPDPYPAEGRVTWKLNLRNVGDGITSRVVVKDVLPDFIVYNGPYKAGGDSPDYLLDGEANRDTLVWILEESDGQGVPPDGVFSLKVEVEVICEPDSTNRAQQNLLFAYYGCADTNFVLPAQDILSGPTDIDSIAVDSLFICQFAVAQDSLPAYAYWQVNDGSDSTLFRIEQTLESFSYCDTSATIELNIINSDSVTAFPRLRIVDQIPAGMYFVSDSIVVRKKNGTVNIREQSVAADSVLLSPGFGDTDSLIWILGADSLSGIDNLGRNDTLQIFIRVATDCGYNRGRNEVWAYARTCFETPVGTEYYATYNQSNEFNDIGTPNVVVTKTPSLFPHHRDQKIDWQVTIYNNGTEPTGRLILIDELPAEVDTIPVGAFSPSSPDSVISSAGGDSLIWIFNDPIAVDDSLIVTIRGQIHADSCSATPDSNLVWVHAGCPDLLDPFALVCTAQSDTAVSRPFSRIGSGYDSLQVDIIPPPAVGFCDTSVIIQLDIVNRDSVTAYPDILIDNVLPVDLYFVSDSLRIIKAGASNFEPAFTGPSFGDIGTLRWTLNADTLNTNDTLRVFIQAATNCDFSGGVDSAYVYLETCDGSPYLAQSATDSIITDGAADADIAITKTPVIFPHHQNKNVSWDITVVNNGGSPTSRIILIDEIPTEMDTVSFSYTNPGGATVTVSPDSVNADSMYFAINDPVSPGDSVTV
ncbi:MAG: hypothetical protein GY869_12015, partial [Planctomycetes bacterium]|nr:hypothetical protein [Planctomycetota bacterium]